RLSVRHHVTLVEVADPANPQPVKSIAKLAPEIRNRPFHAPWILRIIPGDHFQYPSAILRRPRHWTDVVQRIRIGNDPATVGCAIGRHQSRDAAERSWIATRAPWVGTDRPQGKAGCNGGA